MISCHNFIKTEPGDCVDEIAAAPLMDTNHQSGSPAKCGEIFLNNVSTVPNLVFICTFCGEQLHYISTFTEHLQNAHISSNIKMERNIDTELDPNQEYNISEMGTMPGCNKTIDKVIGSDTETYLIIQDLASEYNNIAECEDEQMEPCESDSIKSSEHKKDSSRINWNRKKRNFPCSVCGKTFKTRYRINRHILIHTRDYDYECQICKKAFTSQENLLVHQKQHGKKRDVECEQCDKKFFDVYARDNHMKLHLPTEPYVCSCSATYLRKKSLVRHKRTSCGKKYACEICNETFPQLSLLHNHNKTYHKSKAKNS